MLKEKLRLRGFADLDFPSRVKPRAFPNTEKLPETVRGLLSPRKSPMPRPYPDPLRLWGWGQAQISLKCPEAGRPCLRPGEAWG